MKLVIHDTFNKELPADPILENTRRQVSNACFSYVSPKKTRAPQIIHVSKLMAEQLGLKQDDLKSDMFLKVFTGNKILPGSRPYAMCYGGHQFGNWAGQLGDGRAINLAEIVHNHQRWALQLKGSGETPYSRTADGLAVLRSSIREYLCSEAMYHLNVPTTRALSLGITGDQVMRDVMYNGNPAYEKGAIVCRTAPSFIRFGNFEILAVRQDKLVLKALTDYTIKYFFSHLGSPSKKIYLQFFKEVMQQSLDMVIHWQRVGFVHGVMNTDNMSILGLTIDYGPYGWLEGYDPGWTPNTTDKQFKRYRFGNQTQIVLWNLYKLANALYPLIEDAKALEEILDSFREQYQDKYLTMMKAKIGLFNKDNSDGKLIENLEDILQLTETDMTIFFRLLADFKKGQSGQGLQLIFDAFYKTDDLKGSIEKRWIEWFQDYDQRLNQESLTDPERNGKMNQTNPKYVLRNYMAQLAIDDADKGSYQLIDELFSLLKNPYDDQPEQYKWFVKRPDWARNKIGCSMLSCSS